MVRYSFFLLLITFTSYSQNYKDASYKCHIGHKCEARMYSDEFTKTTEFSDGTRLTSLSHDSKSVGVHKMVKGELESFVLSFSTTHPACVSSKAGVIILFVNGDTIDLPYKGEISCGTYSIEVLPSAEDIQKLITEPVAKIRMKFTDDLQDFEVSEKNQLKFMEKVKCIAAIK